LDTIVSFPFQPPFKMIPAMLSYNEPISPFSKPQQKVGITLLAHHHCSKGTMRGNTQDSYSEKWL
jgi:hypothetical protein